VGGARYRSPGHAAAIEIDSAESKIREEHRGPLAGAGAGLHEGGVPDVDNGRTSRKRLDQTRRTAGLALVSVTSDAHQVLTV
jgi:hypothetical protein